MNTENKLPESWCVKNDGSDLFKDTVFKYLNIHKDWNMNEGPYFYGNDTVCGNRFWLNPFGKELTIFEFLTLSGFTPENFEEKYPEMYEQVRDFKFMENVSDNKCNNTGNSDLTFRRQPNPVMPSERFDKTTSYTGVRTALEVRVEKLENRIKSMTKAMMNLQRFAEDATGKKYAPESENVEVEPAKEGFTWDESFSKKGYFINDKSIVVNCGAHTHRDCLNVFRTEKQALSALAFAQLTHVVAKYNHGKEFNPGTHCNYVYWEIGVIDNLTTLEATLLTVIHQTNFRKTLEAGLKFNRQEDAETSLKVNAELWKQYWEI